MKKNIVLALLTVSIPAVLFLTGCSKDDTDPPVVTVNGSSSEVISLGEAWSDPGATATDEEDGAVTATSNSSATNPNINKVGTYTITYTATDAAGNVGSATRSVRVKNDAEIIAGTYSVSDVVAGTVYPYPQILTVDNEINNRIHFSRFGDYANNDEIYGTFNPVDSTMVIPNQETDHDIGQGSGACDVQRHAFRSTSFMKLNNGFTFDYVDSLTTGSSCAGTFTTGTATYVK